MIDAQIRIFVGLENGKDNFGAACVEPHAFLFNVIVVVLRPLVGVEDIPWLVLVGNNFVYWLNSPRGECTHASNRISKNMFGAHVPATECLWVKFWDGGESKVERKRK